MPWAERGNVSPRLLASGSGSRWVGCAPARQTCLYATHCNTGAEDGLHPFEPRQTRAQVGCARAPGEDATPVLSIMTRGIGLWFEWHPRRQLRSTVHWPRKRRSLSDAPAMPSAQHTGAGDWRR